MDAFDEGIYSELQQNIDEILGDEVSEQLKEELLDELLIIIQQKKRQFAKNTNIAASYYNQQSPAINLYVLSNIPSQSLAQPMISPLQQQQQVQPPIMSPLQQQQQMQPPIMPYQPSMFPMNNFFIPQSYKRSTTKINSKRSTKKKSIEKVKKEKKDKKEKTQEKNQSTEKQKITVFKHQVTKKFNGIIDYLNKKTGGNVHTNHTIEIKASSSSIDTTGNNNVKFIIDYHLPTSYYQSGPEGNTTITFDFKERRINVTLYEIRSMNTFGFAFQLRFWVIEGSNDEKQWTLIDFRENDQSLKGAAITSLFSANKDNKEFYRYIRLRQTGPTWSQGSDKKTVGLKMIEFYGSLQEPESKK